MERTIGFIVLRHVNSVKTNNYWIECCKCIRNLYPDNKIIIIDDNSNNNFVTKIELYNTEIVKSEFNGKGEMLPYYYYAKNNWFDIAVIIHDSVFIKKKLDFRVEKYKLLWEFEHPWDQIRDEERLIYSLTNKLDLLSIHKNKHMWKGCFGGMSIITHEYLKYLDTKYTMSNLTKVIFSRYNRCSFERVIACILQANHKQNQLSLLGNIHKYCPWGLTFDNYTKGKYNNQLPMVKVWTGR